MTCAAIRTSFLAILTILLLCWPALARAAVFTVSSTADDGSAGTLREVIANANAGDTVNFSSTLFGTLQTITLTSGPIPINQNITIFGSPAGVVIDGNSAGNLFTIGNATAPATVSMSNLTLENGVTTGAGPGGAIAIVGSLTLDN
jgi:hypothetical protein